MAVDTEEPKMQPISSDPLAEGYDPLEVEQPSNSLAEPPLMSGSKSPHPPMQQPPTAGPEMHEAMKEYGQKKALNDASMLALNPMDPNYQQKLANHIGHDQILKADHHANVGQMQTDQMGQPLPQYEGPGKEVPQGQMIPAKELPQDRFKFIKDQFKDRIEAANLAGDDVLAGKLQAELAREVRMHPWGSPGNHPGVLGKIGHALGTVGNVVGNAALGERNMSLIPSSQSGINAEEGRGVAEEAAGQKQLNEQSENELRGAQESEAEERGNLAKQQAKVAANPKPDKPETPQQVLAGIVAEDIDAGKNPQEDPRVQQASDAITGIQKQATPPEQALEKQYNDAIEKGDHEKAERLLKVMADVAKAKQAPQRPPQTTVILPGGRVETARPGMTLPEGTQNVGGFAQLNRPTTQERNVGDQAKVAAAGIPPTIAEIDRLKDSLGPISGRWNEFMQGKVGMENPDFAGLRADLLMVSSAVALAHARGRLPENLRAEFDHAINAPKQDPENLKAILQHIQPWMERMAEMGQVGQQQGGGPPTIGNTGGRPSFAQWKNSQNKPTGQQ